MSKNNINKILLNDKNVNYYTKLMILLYFWDYYEDYYIPNRKIMNSLNIEKNNIRRLLHKLEENRIVHVFYKGRKRYFTFIATSEKEKDNKYQNINNIFDYNWLEEEE